MNMCFCHRILSNLTGLTPCVRNNRVSGMRIIYVCGYFLILSYILSLTAFAQVQDKDLQEKFKEDRYYYLSLISLGEKTFKEEEYQKAVEYFVQAINYTNSYALKDYAAYENLGDTYKRQGRADDSTWAYCQALNLVERYYKFLDDAVTVRERLLKKAGASKVILPPVEFPELRKQEENTILKRIKQLAEEEFIELRKDIEYRRQNTTEEQKSVDDNKPQPPEEDKPKDENGTPPKRDDKYRLKPQFDNKEPVQKLG